MDLKIDPSTVISAARQDEVTRRSKQNDSAALKKVTQDFEAIFIESMFKAMRKTIPDGGLFERDNAHEIYQEMLDREIAGDMARHQSIGLADQMYEQIQRNAK